MPPPSATSDPRHLITEEDIKKVLILDKGSNVILKSWKVVDFTKIGDNFICLVTSVEVRFSTSHEEDYVVTYVVKLNPQGKAGLIPEAVPFFFTKECKFYEELVPLLNKELASVSQKPLCVPKCFLVSLEKGKQLLYFEDLRARGFRMLEKTKGLDKDHATLVIQELAKLHSASYLLKKKVLEGAAVSSKFEWLLKDYMTFSPSCKEIFISFVNRGIDSGIILLETVSGYEKCIAWLNSIKQKTEYFLSSYMQSERINAICHGDCWTNNMLFRYNNEGQPVEVMLLDLQAVREASPLIDLSYFLLNSLCGDVRKPNLDCFMSVYHSSYREVLEKGNLPMPFTQEEIMQEYKDKIVFGFLFANTAVPLLFSESKDIPENPEAGFDAALQAFKEQAIVNFSNNASCRIRYLSFFDELMEMGLIS